MRRLLVRGVPGLDVWDPYATSERHLGKDSDGNCINQEVDDHADTRKALRKGSLIAADEATAKLVGVEFKAAAPAKTPPPPPPGERITQPDSPPLATGKGT